MNKCLKSLATIRKNHSVENLIFKKLHSENDADELINAPVASTSILTTSSSYIPDENMKKKKKRKRKTKGKRLLRRLKPKEPLRSETEAICNYALPKFE